MSKFKVGDRVKIVGHKAIDPFITTNKTGKYGIVKDGNGLYIAVEFPEDNNDWWWYDESVVERVGESEPPPIRTLTLSGTTYTLTPYEAPKMVTIDGVVYAMTEVV